MCRRVRNMSIGSPLISMFLYTCLGHDFVSLSYKFDKFLKLVCTSCRKKFTIAKLTIQLQRYNYRHKDNEQCVAVKSLDISNGLLISEK